SAPSLVDRGRRASARLPLRLGASVRLAAPLRSAAPLPPPSPPASRWSSGDRGPPPRRSPCAVGRSARDHRSPRHRSDPSLASLRRPSRARAPWLPRVAPLGIEMRSPGVLTPEGAAIFPWVGGRGRRGRREGAAPTAASLV